MCREPKGHPVRCGLSVLPLASLEYWITRPSAQLRTRRVMTAAYDTAFPRRDLRPRFAEIPFPQNRGSRECRVLAAPAVSCAMCTRKCAHEHTGTAGALRHSLRNGLTAYAELSLETNSSCLHRCRLDGSIDPVGSNAPPAAWHQPRVSGPHGFAVRFSAVRLARRARSRITALRTNFSRLTLPRPPHPASRS